jgi:hypothetical protein
VGVVWPVRNIFVLPLNLPLSYTDLWVRGFFLPSLWASFFKSLRFPADDIENLLNLRDLREWGKWLMRD